jgi:hypothetical protein
MEGQSLGQRTLHYLDAKKKEVHINAEFLKPLEGAIQSDNQISLREMAKAVQDFLVEARKLESGRLGRIASESQISDSQSTTCSHTPLPNWPLPLGNTCPYAFCD